MGFGVVFRVEHDAALRFPLRFFSTPLFENFEIQPPRRHILYILARPRDSMASQKCSRPRATNGFRIFPAWRPMGFGVVFRVEHDAALRFPREFF